MLRRREFIQTSVTGIAGLSTGMLISCSSAADRIARTPNLTGNEASWTFVGSDQWSQDEQGILYSPVWNQRQANQSDLLKREDIAFPTSDMLDDTELSLEFRTYYWSVVLAGILLRAEDSVRYYAIEFVDMGRKGSKYAVRLFVQEETGYRREIAVGFATHPDLPERWVQRGPKSEEWEEATPGWIRARVRAEGNRIQVFVDDKPVIDVRDETYAVGRAGIVARGPITFRNLSLSGTPVRKSGDWELLVEERPSYFYPWPDPEKVHGDNQTYPGIFRTVEGNLGIWMGVHGDPHFPNDILLIWSEDEGRTWGKPRLFRKREEIGVPGYFFGHQDGRLSCLYATTFTWDSKTKGPLVSYSKDLGETWSKPKPLLVNGKTLFDHAKEGRIGPYSPIIRHSDGTLLQYYYHVQTVAGGSVESNAERRDRSLVIRSTDDGKTWTGPHYLDAENFDSNETMGAELADGSIVAFSRTLRASFMWMSTSEDKGLTWSRQVASNCTGECPYLLRHSSGALIMGSRGHGIFMKTSPDEGCTWSRETRISLCSGMMGMTETDDGRVLVVFHEAYRTPTRIRGHFMQVEKDGTLSPA
jgi:hypothetical protein